VRYGQIAMHSAMSLFALTAVAAANLRAPISLGFAFTSTISAVDEAFGGEPLDSQPDSWLVDAAALAATAKPYRVDAGPNAARKRARDTMAPLNHKTQMSTYPLISHWEFPTVVTG
jgi:hypothetical protein